MFSKVVCVVLLAVAASASQCENLGGYQSVDLSCGGQNLGYQSLDLPYGGQNLGFQSLDLPYGAGINNYPLSASESYSPRASLGNILSSGAEFSSAPGVPAIKVLSNNCKCQKTIVRPQLMKQIIEKPIVRQFIQTINKPVVQRIVYKTKGSSPIYQSENIYGSALLNNYESYPAQLENIGARYPTEFVGSLGSCSGLSGSPIEVDSVSGCSSYPRSAEVYPAPCASC